MVAEMEELTGLRRPGMHDSFYEWDEAEKGRVASLCSRGTRTVDSAVGLPAHLTRHG